jgi:tryptophan synthase beta chain
MGIFNAFLDDADVALLGIEAGGEGVDTDRNAATIERGRPGALHGAYSYLLQDADGQTIESHSISAGLDYPGVGPEHSWLADTGRARYEAVSDTDAMDAFRELSRTEGIIPAIESAHAVAGAIREARRLGPDAVLLVNISGRGDKDMETAARWFGYLTDPDDLPGGASAKAAAGVRADGADGAVKADGAASGASADEREEAR